MSVAKVRSAWLKYVEGEKEAFSEVYQHYVSLLTFYCLGKVKDIQLAENFASEALLKTFSHENPSEIKDIENWLFTVANNLCISHLRTDKRRAAILNNIAETTESDHLPEIDLDHDGESLERLIQTELDETERELWHLHSQGFGNMEISENMGLSEKTVANRKSNIRSRLKEVVKKYFNSRELNTGKTS